MSVDREKVIERVRLTLAKDVTPREFEDDRLATREWEDTPANHQYLGDVFGNYYAVKDRKTGKTVLRLTL